MLRKIFRGSGSSSEPQLKVILRDLARYPGDDLYGIVYLHLPVEGQVRLMEVHITGKERAHIGVLTGNINIEAQNSIYYSQYVTMLGVVPEKTQEARAKATAAAQNPSAATRRMHDRWSSMNKEASLRGDRSGSASQSRAAGEGDPEDSSVAPSLTDASSTAGEAQTVRLAPGTYTFPFHVPLPFVLPPTLNITKGNEASCKLVYTVRVDLYMRRGRRYTEEVPLTIRMLPVQLQRWLQLHWPANVRARFPIEATRSAAAAGVDGVAGADQRGGYLGDGAVAMGDEAEVDGMSQTGSLATTASRQPSVTVRDGQKRGSSTDAPTSAAAGAGDDKVREERVLRRFIDHHVTFSAEELAREDAECDAQVRSRTAADAMGASLHTSSRPPTGAEGEGSVFAMSGDSRGSPTRAGHLRTHLRVSDVERIGDHPDDAEEAAGAPEPDIPQGHTPPPHPEEKGAAGASDADAAVCALREPLWELKFLLPVRSGLVSHRPVGLLLILHSNVLCAGRDRVQASLIVDNTRGGGPITKVRFSLVVRELVRSHTESFPITRVEAEATCTEEVMKGKVARLPLVELPVPATTPLTVFTSGGFSTTYLNIRLYSATSLATYSRSAEVELLIVSGVDVKNESRRLRRWTNYFTGREIPKRAESAPAINLTSVNAQPRVLDAGGPPSVEDASMAEGFAMGSSHSLVPGTPPAAAGGVSRTSAALSSSASLYSLRARMSAELPSGRRGGGVFGRSRSGASPASAPALPPHVRRSLDFVQPTYLSLGVGVLGAVGAGAGHADPTPSVNPLLGPPSGSVMAKNRGTGRSTFPPAPLKYDLDSYTGAVLD